MNIQDPEYDILCRMPIYINPTFDEILKLVENKWDSIRIVLTDDNELVLASGYGSTHSSIVKRVQIIKGKRRYGCSDTFILYHEYSMAYFNLEDVSGNDRAGYNEWRSYFTPEQTELLRDLIRESGLSLA